jgi:hypothetical protein
MGSGVVGMGASDVSTGGGLLLCNSDSDERLRAGVRSVDASLRSAGAFCAFEGAGWTITVVVAGGGGFAPVVVVCPGGLDVSFRLHPMALMATSAKTKVFLMVSALLPEVVQGARQLHVIRG